MQVAIAHDYLTQRGGAERVVLSMAKAFPDAPIYTSLYDPEGTFPEFKELDVRPSVLQHLPGLARRHRLGLPLYAPVFSLMNVDADVLWCSSSGWAHGIKARGARKVVYCYNPPRWLYQAREYEAAATFGGSSVLRVLQRPLRAWDRRAAATADCYVTSSRVVAARIASTYGIDAEVLPPPPSLDPAGVTMPVDGVQPGHVLCVSRLLPYKNVRQIAKAFVGLPDLRLVIVGDGPDRRAVEDVSGKNVTLLGHVTDAMLRWLYRSSVGIVAASYEDFGLTPLEAASFGRPSAVLRWGGFLDTMVDETAIFFDEPYPQQIRAALRALVDRRWDTALIQSRAAEFDELRFRARLRVLAGTSTTS